MEKRRSTLTPQFEFDDSTGQYRQASGIGKGRFVPRLAIRGALDGYLDNKTKTVRALAEQLQRREITTAQWQRRMEKEIAKIHLASAAAAKGGWDRMNESDYGRVGQLVKQELGGLKAWSKDGKSKGGGLRAFALEIESGALPLDGRFVRRAMQYSEAGRHSYHMVETLEMQDRGMGEQRFIRHARDSCEDCIELAKLGWHPTGSTPEPGERKCRRKCKCGKKYRESEQTGILNKLVDKASQGDLTPGELRQLSESVATAGFDTRAYQRVREKHGLEEVEWQGGKLKPGDRIPTADLHYLKHVVAQKEWPEGTTQAQYEQSIRDVIKDPKSGIMYSEYLGERQLTFVRLEENHGGDDQNWTLVDYRVSSQSWTTGFRPRKQLDEVLKNHQGQKWLRNPNRDES